jgi:hypothetical protein
MGTGYQLSRDVLLVGLLVIGGHVLQQGLSTTAVKEVDLLTLAAASVGGGKRTIEVRQEVDLGAIDSTSGQDTGNLDADIGLGVYREFTTLVESLPGLESWEDVQLPMTTVFTRRVRRVAWFSAVFSSRRAVV